MKNIKILIANKYFLMNYAIRCILQRIKGFEVLGTSEEELLEQIDKFSPHILVVEIDLVKTNSFELLEELRGKFPKLKILVLLDIDNRDKLLKILEFQLEGYLLKKTSKDELVHAAHCVYKGERYFSKEINHFVIENIVELQNSKAQKSAEELLSEREREILKIIVSGNNNKEIADKLFISENTVATHRRNIMKKLNVRNAPQLILHSLKSGLATLKDY